MAGSSFAVGVGYVSGWAAPERQGSALGIYGLGTIGQSAAVFVGPLAAQLVGWQTVFYIGAGLLLVGALFLRFLRETRRGAKRRRV